MSLSIVKKPSGAGRWEPPTLNSQASVVMTPIAMPYPLKNSTSDCFHGFGDVTPSPAEHPYMSCHSEPAREDRRIWLWGESMSHLCNQTGMRREPGFPAGSLRVSLRNNLKKPSWAGWWEPPTCDLHPSVVPIPITTPNSLANTPYPPLQPAHPEALEGRAHTASFPHMKVQGTWVVVPGSLSMSLGN